jgi:hypothetical protein
MKVTRTQAIKNLLMVKTHADLASKYSYDMECQVNVAQDGGERVDGEFKGRRWQAWTDGFQQWKSFRIPYNANTEPEYEDVEMTFDLEVHAEGIGMTGWDWNNRQSLWVGFDFDAILGHSEKHSKKLTDAELTQVQTVVTDLNWVSVRKSTGGRGLHLYVNLPRVPTQNHHEHAALARAILGKMAGLTGYDFASKVDMCGGNMWVWHRKLRGDGLKLIKEGCILQDVPRNWEDHLDVVTGRRTRTRPGVVNQHLDEFDEITSRRSSITLTKDHEKLITWLEEHRCMWSWDQDSKLLTCHTFDLSLAHKDLGFKGIFETMSKGREAGSDWNCFGFPLRDGGWVIRRFTPGVAEADTWEQDGQGWTRCFYNVDPDLNTVAKHTEGIEDTKGGFNFTDAQSAMKAAELLGASLGINNKFMGRKTRLSLHKDGRLKVEIQKEDGDDGGDMKGWLPERKVWMRFFNIRNSTPVETETANYDDMIRHLVTEADGQDYTTGWTLCGDDMWRLKKKDDIKMFLRGAHGRTGKEVDQILGSCVARPWTVVCRPFQPEFIGDRMWNRNAAQLRFHPKDSFPLSYPTWMLILDHIGKGLDEAVAENEWCRDNGILRGSDYLKCWIASLFQEPEQPLPYLFLYSEEQGTGKSIFHESIELLMTTGVVRADSALINPSGFNGEMEGSVLCVIEETDLRANRQAQERIKDWVTSSTIQIHQKGMTPYTVTNTSHFVQCSNSPDYCPIISADTRITMIEVPILDPNEMVPKKDMIPALEKEAPDFLAEILNLELPKSNDRLNIPIIDTKIKEMTAQSNVSFIELFIREECRDCSGSLIKWSDLYDKFIEWLDPVYRGDWGKIKAGKRLPKQYPKGRVYDKGSQFYIGNIAWATDIKEPSDPYIKSEDQLIQVKDDTDSVRPPEESG